MLAYPTATFDARTILQAPGFRPIGKSSGLQYEKQPEANTAPSLVNRNTANGAFVGSRSKKFIQDNQWNTSKHHYDPLKGSPLSKPGSVGNVDTQAIGCQPKYAEPQNGELKAILNILNGKPVAEDSLGKLSAKQVRSLGRKSQKLSTVDGAVKVAKDFSDAREMMRKDSLIRKAVSQGFTVEEAKQAYNKLRIKEAETALMKEEDPSVRLYDLIDSKVSGTQDGSIRSNDETGLFLAKGGNAVMVKQAEKRDADIDLLVFPSKDKADKKFDLTKPIGVEALEGLIRTPPRVILAHDKPREETVAEVVAKRRGRPKGARDVNPRIRPSGLKYVRKAAGED